MANPLDPFALSIRGVTDLILNRTNKVDGGEGGGGEGLDSEKYEALKLNMEDAELLRLRDEWEKRYAPYETRIKTIFERNKESYLGKRADGQWLAGEDNIASNLQFEAEETFLPAALSKNPEPVVYADNTPEGNALSNAVKTMLAFHADTLVLRRKLTLMVRQWSIYHLGVLKHGWDTEINDVAIENRKIQDFIFDPNGYVDAYGDFIGYLGERVTVTADKLAEMYPDHKAYIEEVVEKKMGSDVVYTEWWSADNKYTFTTFKEVVLDKHKNQYFRYEEEEIEPVTGEPMTDEYGETRVNKPNNHFAMPKKPYTFLSVFSLQEQPHDITGLIEQNIPNQKLITKRTEQIDFNVSSANNSFAFSEDNFNQETAKQAATARKKGSPILVPQGVALSDAMMPLNGQDLPQAVFADLQNNKDTLRTSWGVQGITSEPHDEDQTATGMVLNNQHDTTRIGGGVGDAIEQVADNVFNWLTQLYAVFYDEKHFAAVMGNAKAVEYVTLSNADFDRQLVISVSPDSLKPKDEITNINLAQALFDKGAIGPKTLLTMVDFPNPDEAAADGVLYSIDPMAYFQLNFPEEFAKMQESQMQQAQLQMQQQAEATGMNAQAEAAAVPPEGVTEPAQSMSQGTADASFPQIELPQIA